MGKMYENMTPYVSKDPRAAYRLALVKGAVDPDNFFFYEQSIPPLIMSEENCGSCSYQSL
ncbi:putative tetrahydroberberine oxidase [Helianthus anomalus]